MTPAEVKQARSDLGLTQAEMAKWLGYPIASRVSELERGTRKPGAAVVLLLRAYLDGYRPKTLSLDIYRASGLVGTIE
jgi:transcriptional regulator with XRE-family HTH domain